MTQAERDSVARTEASLREYLGVRGSCVAYFIYLVGGAVVGMLGAGLIFGLLDWLKIELPLVANQLLMTAGIAVGFLLGLRHMLGERTTGLSPYRRDFRENLVQELHCTIADAVEVQAFEDEGSGYFLDVGDGQLLFLQGQYLDDLVDEGRFPTRELFLVRALHSGDILRMDHRGASCEPSRSRGPLGEQEGEYYPKDGEILLGRLDTLEADLRRLARERSHRR